MLTDHPGGEGVVVVAGRPSYAESGEVAAEALRVLVDGSAQGDLFAGSAPGQRVRRGRTGAWPPASCRGGSSLDVGRGCASPPPGSRSPPDGGPRLPPTSSPPWRASASASWTPIRRARPGPARRRPAGRLSRPRRGGEALSSGHFVVAVTGHPSQSVDECADVVLPCAVAHERPGTTTNMEGRVSRLGPKLTAPGSPGPTG